MCPCCQDLRCFELFAGSANMARAFSEFGKDRFYKHQNVANVRRWRFVIITVLM